MNASSVANFRKTPGGRKSMRSVSLIPALVALFLSSAASAQVWQEYVNRENNFQINMPAEPTVTETQYRTVKGTMLPARVFTAVAPEGSITAGTYTVTIVDYSSALNEIGDAVEQARATIKAKGTVKYDEVNDLDRHREWRPSRPRPRAFSRARSSPPTTASTSPKARTP
jgi:hypothetical protein